MNRVLLAFLALLGLVAQAAPAEARLCGTATEIGIVAQARVASRALAARSATPTRPAPPTDYGIVRAAVSLAVLQPQPVVLTVRIGSDRASQ